MAQKPLPNRRSIRLPGYDYSSPGAYFVTICTFRRACLFGEISGGEMHLSPLGKVAKQEWLRLPARFPLIQLDDFVVMPNHEHGIIVIQDTGPGTLIREGFGHPVAHSLATIVRSYKAAVTLKANIPNRIWQDNFWERIIRGESELNAIRQYIQTNPASWPEDRLAPL